MTAEQSFRASLPQYLYTPRLILELFDYSDAHYEALLAAMNSPTAHSQMGDFGIRTPAQFDAMNASSRLSVAHTKGATPDTDVYYLPRLRQRQHGGEGAEGAPTTETPPSLLMGGVSLMQRAASTPPDLGWCLLERYHGQGYATEAAARLLEITRKDLRIEQLIVWPGKSNLGSRRVAEKIGFVEGGEIRDTEGELAMVYVLPGMKVDRQMRLSIWGESDKGEREPVAGSS